MMNKKIKKIVGSVISVSIAFSNIGIIPNAVFADTIPETDSENDFEFQLDTVYQLNIDDCSLLEGGDYLICEFTPDESGYYHSGASDFGIGIKELVQNDYDDSFGYDWATYANITTINLTYLINEDSYYYSNYFLEADHTYYITTYNTDENLKYYVSKVNDYILLNPDSDSYNAVKDSTFTCSFDFYTTLYYESVTFDWYINGYWFTTDTPSITLNSNDIIDFNNVSDGENLWGSCSVSLNVDGQLPYYGSNSFSVYAYNSILTPNVWARPTDGTTGYGISYRDKAEYDRYFSIDAGCDLDCDCSISYQWYKVDGDKQHSGEYDNEQDWLILLPGQTNSYFDLRDPYDILGEPYMYLDVDDYDYCNLSTDLVCIVTFDDGINTIKKQLYFDVDYYINTYYHGNCGNYDPITVSYGSNLTLGDYFSENAMPDGWSYRYTWVDCGTEAENSSVSGCGSYLDIWDEYIPDSASVIGEGKSFVIDTDELTKTNIDGTDSSYIACVYEPEYEGKLCNGQNLYKGVVFIKIDYVNLADAIWAEGGNSWSSCKIPYNKSGNYYDVWRSFYVEAGSRIDCDINYQWYEIDAYKEASGNYDENNTLIELEGQTYSYLQLNEVIHDPYMFWHDDTCDMYIDYVCKVTFDNGFETIEKEFNYRATFVTEVDYGYCNNVDIRFDKVNSISLPYCSSIYEGDTPDGVSYSYTWVNLASAPDCCRMNYSAYGERIDVWSELGTGYDIIGSGKSIDVNTADLIKIFEDDGSTSSFVACIYEPMYNGNRCYGRSMECGFIVYKLSDTSTIPFGSDSVWAYHKTNEIVTDYHCNSYPVLSFNVGSYHDCSIKFQWYMIDSEKELSGNYETEKDLYVPLEGQTKPTLSIGDIQDVIGEPYLYYDEDNDIYSLCTKFVCTVTFIDGTDTITIDVPIKLSYRINSYVETPFNDIYLNEYGDVINFGDVTLSASDLPSGFSYKLSWANCDSFPSTFSYKEYINNEYWNYWDELISNCEPITSGLSANIDTSNLTLHDYEEGKCSYLALILQPCYNGEVCDVNWFTHEFTVVNIYYMDLVEPNTSGVAVNSDNFPDDIFRQYVSDYVDLNKSGYLSYSELSSVKELNLDDMGISDLTGINNFYYLQYLYCSYNNISSLDISTLYNLRLLCCYNNNISSLDLSDLSSLQYVYCCNNNISELVLPEYKYCLYGLDCHSNELDYLDVTNQHYLNELYCYDNELTSLDLTGCRSLYRACIDGNNISTINLDSCPSLKGYYENGPYTRVMPGVSCYGRIDINNEYAYGFALYAGIRIDNSTTVINATPYRPDDLELTILSQPEDYYGPEGDVAVFSVEAEGKGVTYQWQINKDGTWKNTAATGAKTDTLSIDIYNSRDGYKYRCIVTDENKVKLTSDEATLHVGEPPKELAILGQPEDYYGPEGDVAVFRVEAEGEGVTYQWQRYKDGTWKNIASTGSNTDTLSVEIYNSRDGFVYRCVIKDANENTLTTEEVTLYVE